MADSHGEERFTEEDLLPSEDEKRARRRGIVDRVAAIVAVLCAGTMFGGLIALGACAAPVVFSPQFQPLSGTIMGTTFARWDKFAASAGVALLVCEIVRTWAARGRARLPLARARRFMAIGAALCAVYIGTSLSPRINQLHADGARRGDGDLGAELDAIHKRAELIGKIEAALAVGLVALHVLTLRTRDEDEDDEDAPAPFAPGPRP